jgi:hypothetical protein
LDGTTPGSTVVGVEHGQLSAVGISIRKAVRMAFREVPVFEVREVLRLWMDGRGLRSIAAVTPPDRKTIRRVVDVAVGLGLDRDGDVGQLDDAFMSSVMAELAVGRPDRHGESWAVIAGEHDRIAGWVETKVPVVKMCGLLARRSVVVPERTLHRYVADHFGCPAAQESTVPLADCEPGAELGDVRLLEVPRSRGLTSSVRRRWSSRKQSREASAQPRHLGREHLGRWHL